MQHATYTYNMQHIHTTCNIYIQPATALPTSLWNSAMSSAPFRCDAAAYVACCMLSVSRAQALGTQLEQRGSGAGSAAEALHVLERVASLENELTRCEQQVHHRAFCTESIDNGSASFMPHTLERHPGNERLCKGKYRTGTVGAARLSSAMIPSAA